MIEGIELGDFDLESFMDEAKDADSSIKDIRNDSMRQIVFVIDASNSMQGHKIGAVNDCVNNIISKLKTLDRSQEDSVNVSVMGFSTRLFRWTNGFVRASEFKYSYVEMVDGLTDVNAVFQELTDLTNNDMNKEAKKYTVLFSDGLLTEDYSASLAKWKSAQQYSDIMKIAVAFDEDLQDPQSKDFYQEFVDNGIILPMTKQEELLSILLS